jgi:hypothetical protein
MGFREKEALTYKSPSGVIVNIGDFVKVGGYIGFIQDIDRSYGRWRATIYLFNYPHGKGTFVRNLADINKSWNFQIY